MVVGTGIEPVTQASSVLCSIQVSYPKVECSTPELLEVALKVGFEPTISRLEPKKPAQTPVHTNQFSGFVRRMGMQNPPHRHLNVWPIQPLRYSRSYRILSTLILYPETDNSPIIMRISQENAKKDDNKTVCIIRFVLFLTKQEVVCNISFR